MPAHIVLLTCHIHLPIIRGTVSTSEVTLQLENTDIFKNIQLVCFNIFGKQVHKEKVYQHQGEAVIDVSHWKQGMYVILVYSEGKVVGETKIVVQ